MKKYYFLILISLIFILSLKLASAYVSHFYKIGIEYNRRELYLKNVRVVPLSYQPKNFDGQYCTEIRDFNGKLLNKTYFGVPLEIYFDTIDNETGRINGGGVKVLNQTEIILFLPYYKNAKEIVIYKNRNRVLTIDVSDFSKF